MQQGLGAVPGGIAAVLTFADAPALGAMPIHHDSDIQLRLPLLGGKQRIQHFLPRLVVLQIERGDVDAVLGLSDGGQQAKAEVCGLMQGGDGVGLQTQRAAERATIF